MVPPLGLQFPALGLAQASLLNGRDLGIGEGNREKGKEDSLPLVLPSLGTGTQKI